MGFRDILTSLFTSLLVERPAGRHSMEELTKSLEDAGTKISQNLASVADLPANREQLRHIIGIERWGQRRLRVAFGEPPLTDEYDTYQPDTSLNWHDLRTSFQTTRNETVALARSLIKKNIDGTTKIQHNQFGPITIKGWLRYLEIHASLESRRLK